MSFEDSYEDYMDIMAALTVETRGSRDEPESEVMNFTIKIRPEAIIEAYTVNGLANILLKDILAMEEIEVNIMGSECAQLEIERQEKFHEEKYASYAEEEWESWKYEPEQYEGR